MDDAATSFSRDLLGNRPFRALLAGQAVSALGDWVATFALMLLVREITSGMSYEGLAISGILGFRILPALVAAPIASSIADRFDRRRTMIVMDLARAALIASVPLVASLGSVYAIAFVLEGLGLIFLPARDAVVPDIVPDRRLAGANALIMLSQWGTIPMAGALVVVADALAGPLGSLPLAGGLILQRLALPFFFDAFTFLVSAAAILRLPKSVGRAGRAERERREQLGHNPFHAMQTDLRQGTRYLLRDRGLRGLTLGMAFATGGGGALFSLGIPYVKTTLRASDSIFGALVVLWGVGMAAGAWVSQRARRHESELFRIALGGCGAILIVMAALPFIWLALALAVAFGAGLSVALVLGITLAQRSAPTAMRGRVMAAVHVLARVFLILGAVVVGAVAAGLDRVDALGDWRGNRYAMLLAGASMIAGGAAAKGAVLRMEER